MQIFYNGQLIEDDGKGSVTMKNGETYRFVYETSRDGIRVIEHGLTPRTLAARRTQAWLDTTRRKRKGRRFSL
jgi:hypothetical protein